METNSNPNPSELEVEPCPFCGVMPELRPNSAMPERVVVAHGDTPCALSREYFPLSAWNTRVPHPSLLTEPEPPLWPEWAASLLRILEDYGVDYRGEDEIDLPEELKFWLDGYGAEMRHQAKLVSNTDARLKDGGG